LINFLMFRIIALPQSPRPCFYLMNKILIWTSLDKNIITA
jgi:hypothetical protein